MRCFVIPVNSSPKEASISHEYEIDQGNARVGSAQRETIRIKTSLPCMVKGWYEFLR